MVLTCSTMFSLLNIVCYPSNKKKKFGPRHQPIIVTDRTDRPDRTGPDLLMTHSPARRRGLDPPYSADMLVSAALHPLLTGYFLALAILSLPKRLMVPLLLPYAILNACLCILWWFMVTVDPAEPGGAVLRSGQDASSHYCSICRKSITGFDHHCQWLNTCIGVRDYLQFFLLNVVGFTLYGLQTLVGILELLLWASSEDLAEDFHSATLGKTLWSVHICLAGWIALCFGSLFFFHSYLLLSGMGTYDYVLKQHTKRQTRMVELRQGSRAAG
jgi:hypothetical protein